MKPAHNKKQVHPDTEALTLQIKELSELNAELLHALKFTRDGIKALGGRVTNLAANQGLHAFQNSPEMVAIDSLLAKAKSFNRH